MRFLSLGNMYPPHSLGGYELMWSSWVQQAESQGHRVRVLTTDFRVEPEAIDGGEISGDVHRELRWYWRDHDFPRLSPFERLRLERHNAGVLKRHLAEERPDAVVWWAMAGMSLGLIEQVKRAGIPSVAVLADYWLQYAPSVDAWTRMFASRPRLGRVASALTGLPARVDLSQGMEHLFVSEFMRGRAQEALPGLGQSEVLLHGPDAGLFREQPEHAWNWDLLYVGRMDPRKGVDLAVEALAELPPEATLRILGGGDEDYLATLHRLVADLGLEGRVSFDRTPRSRLPEAYGAADILLFPVRWREPFGLVPVESMAVGTPVIASGRGGSGEYLADGRNCLLFDPDEGPGALAAAVNRLAADPELRRRLRAGGLETAERLSAARFNDHLTAMLERAAGRGPAAAKTA